MNIVFDLEGNPEVAFYGLYAGLRMFKDYKDSLTDKKELSIVAAENYCMLQHMKETHPDFYKYAEEEYNSNYGHYLKISTTPDLEHLEKQRIEWAVKQFPNATAVSSLNHAREEIDEVESSLEDEQPNITEYVDVMMLVMDSAHRSGFTVEQIRKAYADKLNVNFNRKWDIKPDGSGRHKKE